MVQALLGALGVPVKTRRLITKSFGKGAGSKLVMIMIAGAIGAGFIAALVAFFIYYGGDHNCEWVTRTVNLGDSSTMIEAGAGPQHTQGHAVLQHAYGANNPGAPYSDSLRVNGVDGTQAFLALQAVQDISVCRVSMTRLDKGRIDTGGGGSGNSVFKVQRVVEGTGWSNAAKAGPTGGSDQGVFEALKADLLNLKADRCVPRTCFKIDKMQFPDGIGFNSPHNIEFEGANLRDENPFQDRACSAILGIGEDTLAKMGNDPTGDKGGYEQDAIGGLKMFDAKGVCQKYALDVFGNDDGMKEMLEGVFPDDVNTLLDGATSPAGCFGITVIEGVKCPMTKDVAPQVLAIFPYIQVAVIFAVSLLFLTPHIATVFKHLMEDEVDLLEEKVAELEKKVEELGANAGGFVAQPGTSTKDRE